MSKDYTSIRQHCKRSRDINKKVIDDFLMNFAAHRDKTGSKMSYYYKKYSHIIKKLGEDFFSSVMAEYIVGNALRANGTIHKNLNHPEILSKDKKTIEYINFLSNHPWRYTFAHIVEKPEKEFFFIEDQFLGDELLVYSPGMEKYCNSGHQNSLYFMLIGYNGECWETFGAIIAMKSITAEDIYIFGTELSVKVDSDESLMELVYSDPMPFFMLALTMETPVTRTGDDILANFVAEEEINDINTEKLKKTFIVKWNKGVYQFTMKNMAGPPHFASAYFIERTNILYRYSMTEYGFRQMSNQLIKAGIDVDPEPDYSLTIAMLFVMEKILKKKFDINRYEKDFTVTNPENSDDEMVDKLNKFMELLIPYINNGITPDIVSLSKQCGINPEEGQSLYDHIYKKYVK